MGLVDAGIGNILNQQHTGFLDRIADQMAGPVKSGLGEIRVVDPVTGGEKGEKLQRFSLIPPEVEWRLAEHYGRGARKYADRNWERGYKWHLSYDALRRHLAQWVSGESHDPETGSHHLIAVIWHVISLYIFEQRGLGTDDLRPPINGAGG